MSSATTSVLTIGLSLDWFDVNYAKKPGIDTNAVRTRVERGFNDLKKVPGLVSDAYYIVPGKEGVFNEIVSKLREGHSSKPWDGVILGFGLRGDDAFTPLFEELVNLVKENYPMSKFLFTGPRCYSCCPCSKGLPAFASFFVGAWSFGMWMRCTVC